VERDPGWVWLRLESVGGERVRIVLKNILFLKKRLNHG